MSKILKLHLLVIFTTLVMMNVSPLAYAAKVDTIYKNGTIITMNGSADIAEAVAVSKDKIVAVGSEKKINRLVTSDTEVVDLKGRTLLPGFIDAHGHFFYTSEYALKWVDLTGAKAEVSSPLPMDYLLDELKKKADATPEGEWVLGWGYDDTNLRENRHPTRHDLDKVSTRHPIFIINISGWISSANSLALKKAGINKDSKDPADGYIQKDDKLEPTGVIFSALPPVYDIVPKYTDLEYSKSMTIGSELYLAAGVTTAQEGWGNLSQWKKLEESADNGSLKVRVLFWPVAEGMSDEDFNSFPDVPSGTAVDKNNMLVLGATKLTADGSLQGYSALLTNPYHQQREGETAFRGFPTYEQSKLTEIVTNLHKKGRQLAMHGNGDGAVDFILNALEELQREDPMTDARPIVLHSQMARDDQLERMKRLNAIPSFFIGHIYFWGDRHYNIYMGPDRAKRMNPAGSALRNDLKFTLHNDTYVTPIDPLMSVWVAVNRQSAGGIDMNKATQSIPVYEALKAVTINAAWQGFEEKSKGSIDVGKFADFVILDENPLQVDPVIIRDIEVKATVLGGELAFGSFE